MRTRAKTDSKRFWAGLGLALFGLVMLLGFCGGIGAFGYAVVRGFEQGLSGRTAAAPAAPEYETPTDARLFEYGQQIQALLIAQDWANVDAQMDWEAFEALTRDAMGSTGRVQVVAGGTEGMRRGGLSTVMHGGDPAQSTFSFRGVFPRDGIPRLRFRRLLSGGGFQYLELRVGVRVDGIPRVVDVWALNTGEDLSQTLAEGLGGMNASDPDLLGRLDGERNPWAEHAEDLKRASALLAEGESTQALAILDAFPPVMRNSRMVSLLRVRAASGCDPVRYAAVLDEVAALRPDDPAVLVMLIDRHSIAQQWAAVAEDIQSVRAFLPDPYLAAIQARMELRAGRVEAARALVDRASVAEPELIEAHDVSLLVALAQSDTATADRELATLMRDFNVDAEHLAAIEGYAPIRALPSFPVAPTAP